MANSWISYSIGWDSSVRKFTRQERRNIKGIQSVTDHGTYDTFAAAYDAARSAYEDLAKNRSDVYLVSEEISKQNLHGCWGMSKAQREEIGDVQKEIPKVSRVTPQHGRGETELNDDFALAQNKEPAKPSEPPLSSLPLSERISRLKGRMAQIRTPSKPQKENQSFEPTGKRISISISHQNTLSPFGGANYEL